MHAGAGGGEGRARQRPSRSAWILRHPAQMQPIAGTTKAARLGGYLPGHAGVELTREEWYRGVSGGGQHPALRIKAWGGHRSMTVFYPRDRDNREYKSAESIKLPFTVWRYPSRKRRRSVTR